jgi:hypothetical protein
MSVGCQQWSLRESTAKWFGGPSEDDDWAPPTDVTYNLDERTAYEVEKRSTGDAASKGKRVGAGWWAGARNANSEPPPRVILPKAREAQKKAAEESAAQALAKSLKDSSNKAADSNASASTVAAKTDAPKNDPPKSDAPKPDSTQSPAAKTDVAKSSPPNSDGPKAGGSPADSALAKGPNKADGAAGPGPATVDTGLAEVDVEGAINALPARYRDAIRKRMSETAEGKPNTESPKIAESAANMATTALAPTTNSAPPSPAPGAANVAAATAPGNAVATPPVATGDARPTTALSQPVTTAEFQAEAHPTQAKPITVRLGTEESEGSSVMTTSHVEPRGATPSARLSWHQHTSHAIQELESQLAKAPPSDPA